MKQSTFEWLDYSRIVRRKKAFIAYNMRYTSVRVFGNVFIWKTRGSWLDFIFRNTVEIDKRQFFVGREMFTSARAGSAVFLKMGSAKRTHKYIMHSSTPSYRIPPPNISHCLTRTTPLHFGNFKKKLITRYLRTPRAIFCNRLIAFPPPRPSMGVLIPCFMVLSCGEIFFSPLIKKIKLSPGNSIKHLLYRELLTGATLHRHYCIHFGK